MASTYSTRISLEKQADGENPNTWGSRLNENVIELVDEAIAGFEVVSVTGPLTLTATQGTTNQARNFALQFAGTLTADTTVTIPAQEKTYFINNNTNGAYTLFIKPAGGTAVSVASQGSSMMMATDGSTIIKQEEVDLNVVATKIELAALSATLSSEIDANTSAITIANTRITNVSSAITIANTSIAANTSLITALSTTLESRIAGVSSTFAATSATLNTRITNVSSTFAATSATLNNRISSVSAATSVALARAVAVSSTFAATSATLNTRITNVSAVTSVALARAVAVSSAMTTRANQVSATAETRIATVSSTLNTAINNKVSVKFATSASTATNATNATNADTLDGQHGSYYQNASNINAGTLSTSRLSGTYGISISGNAATASNAGLLDNLDSTAFMKNFAVHNYRFVPDDGPTGAAFTLPTGSLISFIDETDNTTGNGLVQAIGSARLNAYRRTSRYNLTTVLVATNSTAQISASAGYSFYITVGGTVNINNNDSSRNIDVRIFVPF